MVHGVRSGQQGGGAAARRAGQPVQRHVRRGSYAPGPAGGQASGGGTCGRSGGGPGRGPTPMAAAWRSGTAGSACSAPQARRRQLQRAAAGRRRSGPPGNFSCWHAAATEGRQLQQTWEQPGHAAQSVVAAWPWATWRIARPCARPACPFASPLLPLVPASAACRLTQQRGSHGVQA